MRKCLLLLLLLLLLTGAAAEESAWMAVPLQAVEPDDVMTITFFLPEEETVSLYVTDRAGNRLLTVVEDLEAMAGENDYIWQTEIPAGHTRCELLLTGGEITLTVPLSFAAGSEETPEPSASPVPTPVPPEVTVSGTARHPEENRNMVTLAPTASPSPSPVPTQTPKPLNQRDFTPAYGSPYAGQDTARSYWTLPMDITDEAAVWEVLMQPITVLDTGKKNAEKTQVVIRSEPNESSPGVGVVTCITQGVHVLDTQGDWTLIECYSSSFKETRVRAWNMLVQGWVPSRYLKTTVPDQTLGFVVDKLTQRLYIFKEGRLYDTLLVSTGTDAGGKPYNETRSGEFLLTSAVGEFRSDNIYCSMAIRFNSGDLLHEVPHVKMGDGGKTYKTTEYKLGTRASHGCIRVQRKTTPKGTNMTWIWNNRKRNMKLLIWEDWQGRQIPFPDGDTVLYWNPAGGNMYHTAETCNAAKGIVFEPFLYSQLEDDAFAHLERCEYCTPPLRLSEIQTINANYLPGGDHDPIMTEARRKLQK